MDYVCTVVGNLYIKDLHLDLSYMEIIDLSSEDFKSTPQLRDCIRSRQLELYIPNNYPLAKKFRNRNNQVKVVEQVKESNSDLSIISKNINSVSENLTVALNRIDLLLESFKSPTRIDTEENPAINNLLIKMDTLITTIEKNQDSSKFDLLISKFDNFVSKNSSNNFIMSSNPVEKNKTFADVPIYVPELSTSDISNKNIKAQEVSSEGTDDILEKLKKLKNKETSV